MAAQYEKPDEPQPVDEPVTPDEQRRREDEERRRREGPDKNKDEGDAGQPAYIGRDDLG